MWWQPHNRHRDGDGHGYVSGYGDGDGYGAGAWAGDGVHGGGGGMRVLAICMGICMGMVMSMGQTGPIQGRRVVVVPRVNCLGNFGISEIISGM